MKSRVGKSQRRAEKKKEDQKRESLRRKKIQVREKVGKSRNTVFFQWFVAREGRKVGLLKRCVRTHVVRHEKLHAFVAESTFPSQNVQITSASDHFKSCDVEKVHAVVAQSTFRSQYVQNTPASDHFWKLRCRKVHAVVARSTFRSQRCKKLTGSEHFWKLRCRKSALRCVAKHISKSKCKKPRGTEHFWTFRCRFAWQAMIVHLVKSEQNVRILWQFQKRWQAWDICRGSAKVHFPSQAQYKRHVHRSC